MQKLNTETPAWAVDRLSILALKIYHMEQEANRETASVEHREKCAAKLAVLKEQHIDLSSAIEQLLTDISSGSVKMKTYKQMKMYNDESLNPILYQKKTAKWLKKNIGLFILIGLLSVSCSVETLNYVSRSNKDQMPSSLVSNFDNHYVESKAASTEISIEKVKYVSDLSNLITVFPKFKKLGSKC